ncbi:MAG: AAC(3) family N-acetyltransferase [Desulfuromonas sp.]|nr:AAC(3) family N-acetyltransferase [Desulfuromonas sp.]
MSAVNTSLVQHLFDLAGIPSHKTILVHARLRGLHQVSGTAYSELSTQILYQLQQCKPTLLLVPCYTIYSFELGRVFQRELSHSEVGRFSEELRQQGFYRTSDPMYSVLDILNSLPQGLDYTATFGDGTLCEHLYQSDSIIINIDMPGFYATPIHQLELNAEVDYRYVKHLSGHIQQQYGSWNRIDYRAYLRDVNRSGAVLPPYNHQRRLAYLRRCNVVHEAEHCGCHIAWAQLSEFQQAISAALAQNKHFLVD